MAEPGSVTFTRKIPVRAEVDVVVVGGGPAGCAAAVMAARQGAKVFLAEAHSCFGGMGTAGLVPAFMQFGDGIHFLAAGFGDELLDRLVALGGTAKPKDAAARTGGHCIGAEALKQVYDDMLTAAGVQFQFHTSLAAVETDGRGRVDAAVFAAKSGMFAVKAKVYIDGTGDGDLAAWAGAPFEKGDAQGNMMPGTLCSLWANIDWAGVQHQPANALVEQAFKDGVFTYCDKHVPGIWRVGKTLGGGNIGHTFGVDSTDERSLTEALVWGRKLVREFERYYKHYHKGGYANMELAATGSLLGVRESRRIMGDYVLNVEDFQKRAVFADEIGRYCYPVDIHVARPNDDKEYKRFEKEFAEMRYAKGESYGVPYRCLTPKGLSNVLVTGRCVSTDRSMEASIRVMPGCYITGQAAGVAGAMAAAAGRNVHEVPVKELQGRLKAAGACLPNA